MNAPFPIQVTLDKSVDDLMESLKLPIQNIKIINFEIPQAKPNLLKKQTQKKTITARQKD